MKHKLTQLLFVARCLAFFLWRGKATQVPARPRRIGIMQLSKLGDMVCTTPVFRALKQKYPDSKVVVIGNSINQALLKGHPHVDEYVVWRSRNLAELALDVVVLTSPSAEALARAYLSGAKAIICPRIENGWSPYETRAYTLLRTLCLSAPHRMHHYAPQEYLNMLKGLSIETNDTRKELAIDDAAREKVDRMLEGRPLLKIAIAPGAGNKIKEWPPERFGAVARELVERHRALVVLIGAGPDVPLARTVAEGLPQEHVLNTTGTLSLEELKALVARMSLFVGADTGPLYVAEACGIPTVDIVGPMDEREQPPIKSPLNVVVVPERRRAELHIMNARFYDEEEARRQAESVGVGEVLHAIDGVLSHVLRS